MMSFGLTVLANLPKRGAILR